MRTRSNAARRRLAVLVLLPALLACAPRAMRGGEGTGNRVLDQAALSLQLDREDINFLVAYYLERLESSNFWRQVLSDGTRPLVSIWPIANQTSRHIDDQMVTLLSSIETALVETGAVRVIDRARQQDLIREIGMQQGAAFDPASARRLGGQLGVEYFFTGRITSVEERFRRIHRVQYSLFLQVIHIETGTIEFQAEVTRTKAIQQ